MKQTVKEKLQIINRTPHHFKCDVLKSDFIWLVENLKEQLEINEELQFRMDSLDK